MNLDNLDLFQKLDAGNRLAEIDSLPAQLESAWARRATLPPLNFPDIRHIFLAAAGESALAGGLLQSLIQDSLPRPFTLHEGGALPASAKEKHTLVICVGEEEETRAAFESALKNQCSLLLLSPGGELARRAAQRGIPHWRMESSARPLPSAFVLPLALFVQLGWLPDPSAEISEAAFAMRELQERLRAEVPAVGNPAKRYAGQLIGRWVSLVGAGRLAAVARYWKAQIQSMAKAGVSCESLPQARHHAARATLHPAELLNARLMTLFLRVPKTDPQSAALSDSMRQFFMLEGMNTDFVDARGESLLANLWTLVLFGDYMAYYLAMAYGVNPA